ncbi:MAG: CBU_0592 family membrane protein [Bacteroidia bacterium]
MSASDWVGTIGVSAQLIVFGLNQLDIISSKSWLYLYSNFIGAGLSGIASVMIGYVPFVVLELAWTSVSLYSIIKRHATKGEAS